MKFFEKIERKFGRFAIRNLTIYILVGYAIGYVLMYMAPEIYKYLVMSPSLVFKGQVWRLFTWVITPPQDLDIFIIFMFLFFYWVGTSLEAALGRFRYNVYIFSGIIFMTVGSLVTYLVMWLIEPDVASMIPVEISTYYINLTSFLAFAVCFPNMQVMFMFFIPLKVKWLAVIDLLLIAMEFLLIGPSSQAIVQDFVAQFPAFAGYASVMTSMLTWSQRVMLLVPLLNFGIFFLVTRNLRRISPAEIKRKHEFKKKMEAPARSNHPRHQCVICGRTERDNEDLVFRFCSKCSGNYEYCQDHIFTHEHK